MEQQRGVSLRCANVRDHDPRITPRARAFFNVLDRLIDTSEPDDALLIREIKHSVLSRVDDDVRVGDSFKKMLVPECTRVMGLLDVIYNAVTKKLDDSEEQWDDHRDHMYLVELEMAIEKLKKPKAFRNVVFKN